MDKVMFVELINGLKEIFSSDLDSIILYGSVACGTATEESDIDIAIILKSKLTSELENALSDFVVDMNLKYDKLFSVVDIEYARYQTWQDALPFYNNISKEGVVLWKAA
ncbi:MAG: nucleotidyltransferase domain-containing protein [Phascolarctobacterium sp.]|nr:nucleotidyltransferase domain-containing protein [Phascolarctobacterium sp.]